MGLEEEVIFLFEPSSQDVLPHREYGKAHLEIRAKTVARGYLIRDTFCDTLVLEALRSYKDLGRYWGLVSC